MVCVQGIRHYMHYIQFGVRPVLYCFLCFVENVFLVLHELFKRSRLALLSATAVLCSNRNLSVSH